MERLETNYTYVCKTDKRLILSSSLVWKEKLTFFTQKLGSPMVRLWAMCGGSVKVDWE